MPHLPVFLWIVLAIIPVVIGLLLYVEVTVVQPSIKAERRSQSRPRARADARRLDTERPA